MAAAPLVQDHAVRSEIRSVVRHSAMYGLGSILTKLIGFMMLPFYTHYLTPSNYGVLELLDLSMSLLGMFLNMGLTAALIREYSAAVSDRDRNAVVSTCFTLVCFMGVAAFIAGSSFSRTLSAAIVGSAPPRHLFALCLAAFVLNYIANVPRTYLRILQRSGMFTLLDVLSLVLTLSLNIYFIAVARIGLAGILVSSLITAGLQALGLGAWLVCRVGVVFETRSLGRMARFGLPLILSNLAMFTLNFSDRYFIERLRSVEAVGIYAVGYKFGFLINYVVVQPFYIMWQSRMYVIHRDTQNRAIFQGIFRAYSILLIGAGLAMALVGQDLVCIMAGPSFAASGEVIPLIAGSYVLYGIGYYAQTGIYLSDRTHLIGLISAVAAAANLALNYVAISAYGPIGAAWATLLSFAAIAVASYVISERVVPLGLDARRITVALFCAAAIYVFSTRWAPPGVWARASVKLCLLATFPVALRAVGVLTKGDTLALRSGIQRGTARIGYSLAMLTRKAKQHDLAL